MHEEVSDDFPLSIFYEFLVLLTFYSHACIPYFSLYAFLIYFIKQFQGKFIRNSKFRNNWKISKEYCKLTF